MVGGWVAGKALGENLQSSQPTPKAALWMENEEGEEGE
jgi:hypothetical protein